MYKTLVKIVVILAYAEYGIRAVPQLDLPNDTLSIVPKRPYDDDQRRGRLQTNGQTVRLKNDDVVNEDVVDANILNYDRDRSQRYGPPYNDDNDPSYYRNNNYNSNNNNNNNNNYYGGVDGDDDDDKYYANRRPGQDPYFVSERQRNRYAAEDFERYRV